MINTPPDSKFWTKRSINWILTTVRWKVTSGRKIMILLRTRKREDYNATQDKEERRL